MVTPLKMADPPLTDLQLKSIVDDLEGRFRVLNEEKIPKRIQHFSKLPEANPVLPEPYNLGPKYQSDAPRVAWIAGKTRICENGYTFDVTSPDDTAGGRSRADALKEVLQYGFNNAEEKQGIDIQGDLVDGQYIYGYGMLHWCKADYAAGTYDYDELDELPEGADAARYTSDDYLPVDGVTKKKGKAYRETDDSLQDRIKRGKALAGFGYRFEVFPTERCMWQEDKSFANGMARVVIKSEVGLLDYAERITSELKDGMPIQSENDADADIEVYGEREAPTAWMPSGEGWGERLTVYQIWDRRCFYEVVCSGAGSNWQTVKSFEHPYGMPPFARADPVTVNSPDPAIRFVPALQGVFDAKPFYDYQMSLHMLLAESTAAPLMYLEEIATGAPQLDEEGKIVALTRNSALAMTIPSGFTLKFMPVPLSPAFTELTAGLKQEVLDAAPKSGNAEVGATTAPWAIRLQQAQDSVEPAANMKRIERCLQTAARNIAQVMSQEDEPQLVFGRTENGTLDTSTVISIDPKDITGLNINVTISPISSAEQVTQNQLGKELLDDPLMPITPEIYLRDFALDPHPQQTILDWFAWKAYMENVYPGRLKQKLGQHYGGSFVLGVDGAMVGMGGQAATPEQVIQANGSQPLPQPQQQAPPPQAPAPPLGPPPVPGMAELPPPGLPQMGPLAVPGTVPLGGAR